MCGVSGDYSLRTYDQVVSLKLNFRKLNSGMNVNQTWKVVLHNSKSSFVILNVSMESIGSDSKQISNVIRLVWKDEVVLSNVLFLFFVEIILDVD